MYIGKQTYYFSFLGYQQWRRKETNISPRKSQQNLISLMPIFKWKFGFFRLHTLIVHLHDITARVQNFLRTEYERLGLFEVLCKTLQSLLTSSEELWQTDISGQDGRSIIKEDLDFLFRFVGLQSVSAYGAHGFRILEILLNMLLHMGNFNPDIGNEFRRLALNVLNDAIAELLERYGFYIATAWPFAF